MCITFMCILCILIQQKPAPLARRQSFNGEVKPSGQPPSPLVQASRKKVKVDDLHSNFQSYNKSASLSSLLVNDDIGTDSLSDFPLKQDCTRQDILDMQKDIQHFIVCTTRLKEALDEWATGTLYCDKNYFSPFFSVQCNST